MKRFGPALFSLGLGFGILAGCGGRTGALDDIYEAGEGAASGTTSGGRAGTTGQGGSRAGSRPVGGTAPTAGVTFGGTGAGGFAAGPSGGATGTAGSPTAGSGGLGPIDCQACLTQACTPQVAQCFQDFGCVAIFGCVVSAGCNPLECYSPMFCKNVIDQFGGPTGDSLRQVLDVVSCALDSGCQCQ
jgi:hypothetical protein